MEQNQTTKNPNIIDNQATLPTFMDHVRELQGRLFSIALVFLITSVAAYPLFDHIVNFLVAPLGPNHELVYLTPGGAFGFIIKVCMYVGIIGSLPIIIFHLYRFFLPAVQTVNIRRALWFTIISLFLALVGLLFAYLISLPAALYFLTSFDLHNINPMLTIDSYFSFIMTYMLAGALLFQLPLVISVINSIRPLTPGGMMKYQRHLIVSSFVVAAVISPTPDALNQALLAMPVVIMYQASIVVIWFMNLKKRKRTVIVSVSLPKTASKLAIQATSNSVNKPNTKILTGDIVKPPLMRPVATSNSATLSKKMSVDGFRASYRNQHAVVPISVPKRSVTDSPRPVMPVARQATASRGIDGFMMPRRQLQQ